MGEFKYRSARKQKAADEANFRELDTEEEKALQYENNRKFRKERKRERIEKSQSYRSLEGIQKAMDVYQIDPILGFFLPGIGDVFTKIFTLPFIYVALVKVKSIPLTLAVTFNALVDVVAGLIPYIDILLDTLVRSYKKNYRLIIGFVNDDRDIIQEVNEKAFWMGLGILFVSVIIYFLVKLVVGMFTGLYDLIADLFAYL